MTAVEHTGLIGVLPAHRRCADRLRAKIIAIAIGTDCDGPRLRRIRVRANRNAVGSACGCKRTNRGSSDPGGLRSRTKCRGVLCRSRRRSIVIIATNGGPAKNPSAAK